METRTALLTKQKEAQGTLDKIRKLIELVQVGHGSKFLPAPLAIPAASTPSSTAAAAPLLIITTLADPGTPGGLLAIPATPTAAPAATVLAQIQAVPSSEPSH